MRADNAKHGLKGNIWKFFLYSLSQRRQYFPILAIFFLTLPDTTAQQIGIYSGAGYLTSFLFEIPSGYFADKFGHKKTLVLAKLFMIVSTLLFVFAQDLYFFVFGMIFLSLSFAFSSGTGTSFLHDTLVQLKKEKDFTRIHSRIDAYVSLISVFLIISLPFLTTISILLPLQINLVLDVLGFFFVIFLVSPQREGAAALSISSSFVSVVKKAANPGFYIASLFTGIVGGFFFAAMAYKEAYLAFLGYPVVLLGFIMGLSRFVWFGIGNYAHVIEEKIGIKTLLHLEIFIFPLFLILAGVFTNPYVVGILILLPLGYFFGRRQIIEAYFIRNLIKNKKYKATMLSVKKQTGAVIQAVLVFVIGFAMARSFSFGYLLLGFSLFFVLLFVYAFLEKYLSLE